MNRAPLNPSNQRPRVKNMAYDGKNEKLFILIFLLEG